MQDKKLLMERLEEIKNKFIAEIPNECGKLFALYPEISFSENSFKQFYQIVHQFSGNCGMFGLNELGISFQDLEKKLKLMSGKGFSDKDMLFIKNELIKIEETVLKNIN